MPNPGDPTKEVRYEVVVDTDAAKAKLKEFDATVQKGATANKTAAEQTAKAHQASAAGMDQSTTAAGRNAFAAIGLGQQYDNVKNGIDKLKEASEKAEPAQSNLFAGAIIKAAAFIAVIRAAAQGLKEFFVESTLTAARTEVLGVAVANLGRVNNISSQALFEQEARIKSLNITTQEARIAITRFIQADLDLTKAAQLARVAQDAGVIANINSAEALDRLIHGIVTLQPRVLRNVGIFVLLEQEYKRVAQETGRTTDALSQHEKQQIALNAVLREGAKLQGTYETAFEKVGKLLTSLPRYIQEAENAIGEKFLPILDVLVRTLISVLELVEKMPGLFIAATAAVLAFTAAIIVANTSMGVGVLIKFANAIGTVISVMAGAEVATVGFAGTLATWILGWGAVAIAIGYVISQLVDFRSASDKANDVTDVQIAKTSDLLGNLKAQKINLDLVNQETKTSEERHDRLAAAMKLLDPVSQAIVKQFKNEEDQINKTNDLIKEKIALNQVEAQAQFATVLQGYIEKLNEYTKAQEDATKALNDFTTAKAGQGAPSNLSVAAQGSFTSFAKTVTTSLFTTGGASLMAPATIGATGAAAGAAQDKAKGLNDEVTKMHDKLVLIQKGAQLTADEIMKFGGTTDEAKEKVKALAKELESLNNWTPMPDIPDVFDQLIQTTVRQTREAKKLKDAFDLVPGAAKKLKPILEEIPNSVGSMVPKALTAVDDFVAGYTKLGKKAQEEQKTILVELLQFAGEQMKLSRDAAERITEDLSRETRKGLGDLDKDIMEIGIWWNHMRDQIAKAPISGKMKLEFNRQVTDITNTRTQEAFDKEDDRQRDAAKKLQDFIDKNLADGLARQNKEVVDQLEKRNAVRLEMESEFTQEEIGLTRSETDKLILEQERRTIEFQKHLKGMHDTEAIFNYFQEQQAILTNRKLARILEDRHQELKNQIQELQVELSFSQKGVFVDQDQVRFRRDIAVEITKQNQELVKAMQQQVDADTLAYMIERDRLQVLKLHQQEWDNLFNSIEENAGRVFDAMLASGKSVFQNLMSFIKSVFLTELRREFSKLVAGLFTPVIAQLRGIQNQAGSTKFSWKDIFGIGAPPAKDVQPLTMGDLKSGNLGDFGPGGKYGNSTFPWKGVAGAKDSGQMISDKLGTIANTESQSLGLGFSKVLTGLNTIAQTLEAGLAKIAQALMSIHCVCPGEGQQQGNQGSNILGKIFGGIGAAGMAMSVPMAGGGAGLAAGSSAVSMSATTPGFEGLPIDMGLAGGVGSAGLSALPAAGASLGPGAFISGLTAGGTVGGASAAGSLAAASATTLPTVGLGGAASVIPGLTTGGTVAAGAGAAGAGAGATGGFAATHGLFGISFAHIGAFLANPITIAVAAAVIAGIIAYKILHNRQEKKYQKEIMSQYQLVVNDMNVLKMINDIGKKFHHGDHASTLKDDMVQGLLINYAQKTGQDPSLLPLYQKFYGKGYKMEPLTLDQQGINSKDPVGTAKYISSQTTITPTSLYARENAPGKDLLFNRGGIVPGADVGMDVVSAMVTPREMVLTQAHQKHLWNLINNQAQPRNDWRNQYAPQVITPLSNMSANNPTNSNNQQPIVIHAEFHMDTQASENLMNKGFAKATKSNTRALTKAVAKGLGSDFYRKQVTNNLYS